MLSKLRLERLEKLYRYLAGKRVSDRCKERLTGFSKSTEQIDALIGFPVRQGDPFSLRKPRVVQITADRFACLIDRYRCIFLGKFTIQFF